MDKKDKQLFNKNLLLLSFSISICFFIVGIILRTMKAMDNIEIIVAFGLLIFFIVSSVFYYKIVQKNKLK